MSTLIAFAALFASIFLEQLGSGSLGPLDALAGAARGFSEREIGLIGSGHYVGFLLGCYLAPRLIGRAGHARVFAAAAAVGAIGALAHPLAVDPYAWAGLRILTGVSIASAYTVVDAWLHARTGNASRGRVFGIYRVVDMTGQVAAQGLIGVLDPASYAAYNVVAIFCCLCLLPLSLTNRTAPTATHAPRLAPIRAWRLSPTAMAGVVVAAASSAAFRMVGPIYAEQGGLVPSEIALFLAAGLVGGVAAQIPVGWIADRVERRRVLLGLSGVAAATCFWFAHGLGETPGAALLIAGSFAFGLTAFPIYSVAATYANDYAEPGFVIDLNASIVFYFSLGAIAAPVLAAELIGALGPGAMFDLLGLTHLSLIGFALYRATRRPGRRPVAPYRFWPRTSMVLARLLRADATRPGAARSDTAPEGAPGKAAPEGAGQETARVGDGGAQTRRPT
ncbi:MAG: MFS transporter [Paracoccaceae bacterium]